jgi:hypothetical protein
VVEREATLGAAARERERAAAARLLGVEAPLESLRADLANAIRTGAISLENPDLRQLLRDSVLAQVLIDQPGYPGAVEARDRAT